MFFERTAINLVGIFNGMQLVSDWLRISTKFGMYRIGWNKLERWECCWVYLVPKRKAPDLFVKNRRKTGCVFEKYEMHVDLSKISTCPSTWDRQRQDQTSQTKGSRLFLQQQTERRPFFGKG